MSSVLSILCQDCGSSQYVSSRLGCVRVQETSKQHRAYRNLLLRHADQPSSLLAEAARSGTGPTPLRLPFILIQVNPEAAVEIQISEDNRQALFDFARYPSLPYRPCPWPLPPQS